MTSRNSLADRTAIQMTECDNAADKVEAVSSDSWCTPGDLCALLGAFDLDPCSNARSKLIAEHSCSLEGNSLRCIGRDGLSISWRTRDYGRPYSVFVNPPYSNPLPWCLRLTAHNGPWVALVKLDPSTKWWAALMRSCSAWAPFTRRLKFDRPDKPPLTANFPSALVWSLWRPSAELQKRLWIQSYEARTA